MNMLKTLDANSMQITFSVKKKKKHVFTPIGNF